MTTITEDRIASAQELAGKSFSEFTKDDFIAYYFNTTGFSLSAFNDHKQIAKEYLRDIGAGEALIDLLPIRFQDLDHEDKMENEFFADFNDLYESLVARINKLSIKVDSSIFDAQAAILMVAWAGVTSDDAANIKKSDVNEYAGAVIVNGREYKIPQDGMNLVVRYAQNNRLIKQNNNGLCEMFLKDSNYLFRTFKTDKMTPHAIRASVPTKLNIPNDKEFSYNNVRLSGVFWRAMQFEKENGTIIAPARGSPDETKDAFRRGMEIIFDQKITNDAALRQMLARYRAYKNFFHKRK